MDNFWTRLDFYFIIENSGYGHVWISILEDLMEDLKIWTCLDICSGIQIITWNKGQNSYYYQFFASPNVVENPVQIPDPCQNLYG